MIFKKLYRFPIHYIFKNQSFWNFTPIIFDRNLKCLHTFNDIPVTKNKFIVSFENELPRYLGKFYNWQLKIGYDLLSSNNCRHILSISNIAAKLARERFSFAGYDNINDKISVFRGGLRSSFFDYKEKNINKKSPIKLLFVGCDAVGKGLLPCIQSIDKIIKNGINVQLTIVSRMLDKQSYILKEYAPKISDIYKLIENKKYIRFFKGLPNQHVRELMHESDLLLFPSYDESLGYVIIEAGLEGTPSVANNIFAIPELIQSRETGFLINQQLGSQNRWIGIWQNNEELKCAVDKANFNIINSLCEILSEVSLDRDILVKMGMSMRRKMETMYNMEHAAKQLKNLYDNI